LPLSEKARIEVYLPDVSRAEYQDLLVQLQQEFTYTFGGCTTVRGLEGNYLSRGGLVIRDRVNLVYTDLHSRLGATSSSFRVTRIGCAKPLLLLWTKRPFWSPST